MDFVVPESTPIPSIPFHSISKAKAKAKAKTKTKTKVKAKTKNKNMNQSKNAKSPKHIRPRIRSRTRTTKAPNQDNDKDLDALLQNIRQRMTISTNKSHQINDASTKFKEDKDVPKENISVKNKSNELNKSKKSKTLHSNPNTTSNTNSKMTFDVVERIHPISNQNSSSQSLLLQDQTKSTEDYDKTKNSSTSIEMDLKGAQIFAASDIEGYHAALENPVEVSQEKAKNISNDSSIDAHRDETFEISWHRKFFESDTDNDDDYSNEYDNDYSNDDDDDDERKPEPKPFILFWQALSGWITPESIQLIQLWQGWYQCQIKENKEPCMTNMYIWEEKEAELLYTLELPVDRSDIGVSRCNGLKSMLKMHLPKCMDEYFSETSFKGIKNNDWMTHQMIEKRLFSLCQSFDYSYPMVKLNIDPTDVHKTTLLWRALCSILIHIVIGGDEMMMDTKHNQYYKVPDSVWDIGIGREEYKYLIQKAMITLKEAN